MYINAKEMVKLKKNNKIKQQKIYLGWVITLLFLIKPIKIKTATLSSLQLIK